MTSIDAGMGNDLLIGGLGEDTLKGSAGEDILIGGTTDYDADEMGLRSIMAEWTAKRSFATRVKNLTNGSGLNGQYVLILGLTVRDDLALDLLTGSLGSDWFFSFATDSVTDRSPKDR